MSRKLSLFQRRIMALAYKNHAEFERMAMLSLANKGYCARPPDLYYAEIYSEIFCLKTDYVRKDGLFIGRYKFKYADPRKLESARASTSRSLKRLEGHGLIRTRRNSLNLSLAGIEYAKTLLDTGEVELKVIQKNEKSENDSNHNVQTGS